MSTIPITLRPRDDDNIEVHVETPDGVFAKAYPRDMIQELVHRFHEQLGSCADCGRRYGDEHGFPDLIIPVDAWRRISPSGEGQDGGALCPSCICARLHKAGIQCEGAFVSGPIESIPRWAMLALRGIENLERRPRHESQGHEQETARSGQGD